MPVNPFNPSDFGFPEGSAIFDYPLDARKLINEARIRIQGAQAYGQFWDRVLTPSEKESLGSDLEACYQANPISINLLCRLRNWTLERAVIEIAYRLNFLTPQVYTWLREVAGDPIPGEANTLTANDQTPAWDRETGRLAYSGKLCRQIRVARATSIVPVLDAFEQAGWPSSVPFQNDSFDPQRIHDVVGSLNTDLSGIRFRVSNEGICWDPQSS